MAEWTDYRSGRVKGTRKRRIFRFGDEDEPIGGVLLGWIRRSPAGAFLALILLALSTHFIVDWATRDRPPVNPRTRAERFATLMTEEIGNGLEFSEVRWSTSPSDEGYDAVGRAIVIDAATDPEIGDEELLCTVANQCVHAVFHQSGLASSVADDPYTSMVSETAAAVLGPHLAGVAARRSGINGDELTQRHVEAYLADCRRVDDLVRHEDRLSEEQAGEIERDRLVFGPPQMAAGIDRIARSSHGTWEAAHTVFGRYLGKTHRSNTWIPEAPPHTVRGL